MKRIDECFLFVAEDEQGEGLIGQRMSDGCWMPFVCADRDRVDSLREAARRVSKHTGKRVRLIRFSVREELEVIE